MGHALAHGTQGAAVYHVLLFLVGVQSLHSVGGCEIDDGSVVGGAGNVHHGADPRGARAHEAACRLGDFCAQGEEAGWRPHHGRLGGEGEEAAPAAAEDGPGEVRVSSFSLFLV